MRNILQSNRVLADRRIAIDVERLLRWAYHTECVARIDQDEPEEVHSSSNSGMLASIGRLGCLPNGRSGGSGRVHPDADLVHRVVMGLDRLQAWLVMSHAQGLGRPDAIRGVIPRPRPLTGPGGRLRLEYDPSDKARNYGWCPLVWSPDARAVERAHLVYRLWHGAVCEVMRVLQADDRLELWVVDGFRAPQPSNRIDFTREA